MLTFLFTSIAFAQQKTISGTISDEDGLPLPGVNVIVKNTSTGTQTDFNGFYSLKADQGAVLVYSYLGFETKEITIGDTTSIDVQLEAATSALEEVVVVAYGTQSKESLVGAVLTVDEELIERTQATSITSALQGNAPGLNIITSGGVPGTNPTIRIRGVGSINASADPLIILDGAAFNGNLNTISQDQIASITVLKDASSTSLYGSRAANGVIVITTKKGRKNTKAQLSVNSNYGISTNAVKFQEILGSEEYMRYSWEAYRNANQYVSGQSPAEAATNATNGLITNLGYNPYGVNNPIDTNGNVVSGASLLWDTDWLDALTRTGSRTEHGLTVSGGSDNTSYFFSSNYLKQDGNIRTTVFERFTSRLRIDSDVLDWLKVGLSTSYSTSRSNTPTQAGGGFQSAQQWAYTVAPIYPIYRRDESGQLILDPVTGERIFDYGGNVQSVNGSRPIFSLESGVGALTNYKLRIRRNNTILGGYAEAKITEDLKFKTSLSYENYYFDDYQYSSSEFGNAAGVDGRVAQDRNTTTTLNAIQALNYAKNFGMHNVSLDAIYEAYQVEVDNLGATGVGCLPGVEVLNGFTTAENVSGSFDKETLNGYLGRLRYNYNEKYFLEGSFRRDGSSRFASDVRWGNFYSVGGSWILSKENFLANSDIISYLKLRASYGELGNYRTLDSNDDEDRFPYVSSFTTGFPEGDVPGVQFGGVVDPRLTWEKTASQNYGIDFGFFNGRINGNVDWYDRESIDLIFGRPLAPSTGNQEIVTNTGSIRNFGLEVALNGEIVRSENFDWSAGFNFSLDRNEITELTQDSFIEGTKRWEVGRSIYDFYIREWAGVDPADGYGMWYEDVVDADGNVTGRQTTKDYNAATRYYANDKRSLPDVIGGFNTSLRYKNFDFNALLNFSFGSYLYDSTYAGLMGGFESPGRQGHVDLANRWQQPGDVTDVPLFLASNNDFNSTSTRFLFRNDYVRVKSLNLGYNFNDSVLSKIGVSSLRLYLQGDNLFTFQSHKGIDPEQNLAGTTDSRSGLTKTVTFGINAQF